MLLIVTTQLPAQLLNDYYLYILGSFIFTKSKKWERETDAVKDLAKGGVKERAMDAEEHSGRAIFLEPVISRPIVSIENTDVNIFYTLRIEERKVNML